MLKYFVDAYQYWFIYFQLSTVYEPYSTLLFSNEERVITKVTENNIHHV